MRVISYDYNHPDYRKPHVEIRHGIWPFSMVRNYICISVGFFCANWFCIDNGEHVSVIDHKLYGLLTDTGVKMQLEAMKNVPSK